VKYFMLKHTKKKLAIFFRQNSTSIIFILSQFISQLECVRDSQRRIRTEICGPFNANSFKNSLYIVKSISHLISYIFLSYLLVVLYFFLSFLLILSLGQSLNVSLFYRNVSNNKRYRTQLD
jgi:hypothetical protein